MAKSKPRPRDQERESDREGDGGKVKRQEPVKRDGAYVVMLLVTLVAMTTGCVLLYLDFEEYGKQGNSVPKEPTPAVLKLGTAPKAEPPPVTGGDAVPKTDPMPKGDPVPMP